MPLILGIETHLYTSTKRYGSCPSINVAKTIVILLPESQLNSAVLKQEENDSISPMGNYVTAASVAQNFG